MSTEELDFTENLISIGLQLLLLENTRPEFDISEKTETHHTGSGRKIEYTLPKLIGVSWGRKSHLLPAKNPVMGSASARKNIGAEPIGNKSPMAPKKASGEPSSSSHAL